MTTVDIILGVGVLSAIAIAVFAFLVERRYARDNPEEPVVKGRDCAEELNLMQGDIDTMRDDIGHLRAEVERLTAVVRILAIQLKSEGIEPIIELEDDAPDLSGLSMSSLRNKIASKFTVEGIMTLAFDLGLDEGEIKGETKNAKIISLLDAVNQRGKLMDLILLLKRERPNTRWSQ